MASRGCAWSTRGGTMVVMRKPSVANGLRDELVMRDLARTPEQRVADALALGEQSIVAYMTAHGVGRASARAFMEEMRAAGRKPSRAARPRQ